VIRRRIEEALSLLINAGGKSAPEVREMFARVARRYDFLNHFLSLGRDIYWRQVAAREAARLAAGDLIVDVCTGTGDLAFAFHQAAPEAEIFAVDFSPEMIALALRKAAQTGIQGPRAKSQEPRAKSQEPRAKSQEPRAKSQERRAKSQEPRAKITFAVGDALALPLADGSAALAAVAFGLRNVADTDGALKEMVRVVRPGGKVLVLEFTCPQGRLLGPAYMFYLRHILPLLGRLLAGGAGLAYGYLPRSVEAFAGPGELSARLAAAGLREVRAMPLTGGAVHLYVGLK
jgi:demethylmenaquinone methyltransferase/2-methoxy-6-polyprenyl-1,4-benzoquinol methylase